MSTQSNQKLLHHSQHGMSKITSIHRLVFKIQQILRSSKLTPTQKASNQLLTFLNLHQHAVHTINSFLRFNFRILSPDWPHPFFTMKERRQTKMEVGIRLWAPNLGISPKNMTKLLFKNEELQLATISKKIMFWEENYYFKRIKY